MKREEMVEKMNDFCMQNGIGVSRWDLDRLLAHMIDAGMEKPRLEEMKCQAIMDVYYGGYTLNQWDEDFEKDPKIVAAFKRRESYANMTPEQRSEQRKNAVSRINKIIKGD